MKNIESNSNIWKKILKYTMWGLIFIVLALFSYKLFWKLSGSNQWELQMDDNNIKVYTLKSPGSSILKVKGVSRVKSSLSGIVALLQDQSTCAETGCLKAEIVEEVSEQLAYVKFSYPMPYGLDARDFMVKSLFYQNPKNREVFFDFTAVPNKVALDDCCFRVTHFYVFWRFTPLGNGEIEIELIRDIDPGGFMPDHKVNEFMAYGAYSLLGRLQKQLDREKYRNAKFDFITELDNEESADMTN